MNLVFSAALSLTFLIQSSLAGPIEIYDQTTAIVTQKFYDQTFRGLNWSRMVQDYRTKLNACSSDEDVENNINALLENLHASHTEFLSSSDQEYWGLKSVFSGEIDGYPFKQIGAWFVKIENRWFVKNVFSGSNAEQADLRVGDEIISANGTTFKPVESFDSNRWVTLEIRRRENGPLLKRVVKPTTEGVQRSLLRATQRSFKVIQVKEKKVAYFHLWSGTHDQFKESLKDAAIKAQQSDAMILDLRDGFGGAYPEYLNPFLDRDPDGHRIVPLFSKPLYVLINDGVRSGKEWITYLIQKRKRGVLIGSRTKGYFLAGEPFEILTGRFLLYLAVEENPAMPGLENNGVWPDVSIDSKVPYSEGADPIFESAIQYISNHL